MALKNLLGLFDKFFGGPTEVKVCLEALDKLDPLFENLIFYSKVKATTAATIKNPANRTHLWKSLHEEKYSPRELCVHMIGKYAAEELSMGRYHIYRGVLNMEGKELQTIFRIAVEESVKSGKFTAAEAETERKNLEAAIKDVG